MTTNICSTCSTLIYLSKEAKAAHQYTDTTGFTLKCLVCGTRMKGEAEAQQHAMSTKHTNFSEV